MAWPKPGAVLELRVDSLADGGRGVARREGFVIFVDGAFPGDRVRARVDRIKKHFAEATVVAIVEPGAERTVPACAHYPDCGGCRLQDLAYPAHARFKERQVRDALARIAGIADPPLDPIVPAAAPYAYRNKLEYAFVDGPAGVSAGLHRAKRHDDVLPIERCWLTGDLGNAIRDAVREWARAEGLRAYDHATRRGFLRHLVVREAPTTGSALVLLVTSPGELPGAERLIASLTRCAQIRSIHWAVNEGVAEVTALPTTLLFGDECIEERILGLRFRVGPATFMQTNTAMVERLYAMALEEVAARPDDAVFDLYCGIGTLSLALARQARAVFGMDVAEESIARARENAKRNAIDNASFLAGDVGATLERLREIAGEPPAVVLVDPPRAGLAPKALRKIAALAAPRLVYVSCNPATLAGDAKQLIAEHGYRLARARPLDQFPQTFHVEAVARFER